MSLSIMGRLLVFNILCLYYYSIVALPSNDDILITDEGENDQYSHSHEPPPLPNFNNKDESNDQHIFEEGVFQSQEIEVTNIQNFNHSSFQSLNDVKLDLNNKRFTNVFDNSMKSGKNKEKAAYDKTKFQEHIYEEERGGGEDKCDEKRNMLIWHDYNCGSYPEVYAGVLRTTNTPSFSTTTGKATNYDSMTVADLKIKSSDRSVYYTGNYDTDNQLASYQSCFLVRVDAYGTYKSSLVISHPTPSQMYSECYALELTTNDKVVAVGVYYNSATIPSDVFGSKTSALIVYTDLSFTSGTALVKIWSGSLTGKGDSYLQVARDVTSTKDGSIYITGYNAGWSSGGQLNGYDCFVLRLNSTLEVVYAKSFGSNLDEQCYSIQMSRNFDYIYLGGNQLFQEQTTTTTTNHYRLVFFKLNGYADQITNNLYVYAEKLATNTLTYDLKIRRIMATNPRGVFSGGVDSVGQFIYFCASYYDGTQYDWVYGQLDYTLALKYAFKYGSPTYDDVMGDCAITNDGRFMVGSFGSSNYQPRSSSVSDIQNEFVYSLPNVADYPMSFDPVDCCYTTTGCDSGCGASGPCCNSFVGYCCCCEVNTQNNGDCQWITTGTGSCATCYNNGYYEYYVIIKTQFVAIRNYCRTQLASTVQPYLDEYNDNVYTWHTCRYYTFDWNSIDCSVSNLRFTQCPATGSATTNDKDCHHPCYTLSYQYKLNLYKPWYEYYDHAYNTAYTYHTDGVSYQIQDFIYNYLCNLGGSSYYTWMPYQFCSHSATYPDYSDMDMIFEQDCEPGYVQYSDFFIFKLDLTQIASTSAYYDYQPMNAVYYGQYDGDEQPLAMGVDEFGFIYVAGTTNSKEFGMYSGTQYGLTKYVQYGMLYVKTHWDLNIELIDGPSANPGVTPEVVSETYLKSRFVTPKKFKNYYVDFNGVIQSYGVTFMYCFLSSCSPLTTALYSNSFVTNITIYPTSDTARGDWKPYAINEKISNTSEFALGTQYTLSTLNSAYSVDITHNIYSYAQVTLTQPYTYFINKNTFYEIQLSKACFGSVDWYVTKSYFVTVGATSILSGAPITLGTYSDMGVLSGCAQTSCIINTTELGDVPYLSGKISSASTLKGIYYLDDYLVTSSNYIIYCSNRNDYHPYCGAGNNNWINYYNAIDYPSYESLKRFQMGVRIKFVLEDLTVSKPTILTNIPDQTPTVGFWNQLVVTPATYFTPSTECKYMYAKQGINSASSYAITYSTMLPYWINYYEANNTFVMYPPLTLPTISVQLFCCNNLDYCATNTFQVTPQNTEPTMESSVTESIYVLQYDTAVGVGQHFTWSRNSYLFDDADVETSSANDFFNHMDHTVYLTYTGGLAQFKQVDFIGLIYGQVMSTSTFTTSLQPQKMTFTYYDQYMYSLLSTDREQGWFWIIMNRQPQYTTIGQLYSFSTLDPMSVYSDPSGIFGDIFPWLKQSPSSLLYVDTSQWFVDKDSDVLTYSITYSDGTPLPGWLWFSKTSGELAAIQYTTIPSEYMNLKITAYDTKEGFYSYYKTLLVDTAPKVIVPHVLIYAPIMKQFSYYLGDNIIDQNGDQLTLVVSNSVERTLMTLYGIDFSSQTKTLFGTFLIPAYIPEIQITATDTYGLSNTIYVSVIATDLTPLVRSKVNASMPDQTIYVKQKFYFEVPKNIFYDQTNGSSLLMFATTMSKTALPSWINFNPYSYGFYGIPPSVTTLEVLLTVMNPITQQTSILPFYIYVIPNSNPKTNVKYLSQDYLIMEQAWFESTASIVLFSDREQNTNAQVTATASNGQSLPSWLQYNKYNKTVYGLASTPGLYFVDFTFTDDGGYQTFANIKIEVIALIKYPRKLLVHYVLTCSATAAICVFFIYAWQFHLKLLQKKASTAATKKDNKKIAREAIKRFGHYKDVNLKYYLPNSYQVPQAKEAVVTKDYDFLKIDSQYKGNERFEQQMIANQLRMADRIPQRQFKSRFE